MTTLVPLEKRPLTVKERKALTKTVATKYMTGKSIRAISVEINRSYGFTHKLLTESDVRLRPRGGNYNRK